MQAYYNNGCVTFNFLESRSFRLLLEFMWVVNLYKCSYCNIIIFNYTGETLDCKCENFDCETPNNECNSTSYTTPLIIGAIVGIIGLLLGASGLIIACVTVKQR